MSKQQTLDVWAKVDLAPREGDEDGLDTTVLFVGDSRCGKSTLIQGFLKPTVTKDPKPTFALEYNFARKKATGANSSKMVAHIWELGGDMCEPKLMEIAVTLKTLSTASVVVCCDLSKPNNVVSSLLRWISFIKEAISKRMLEIQATNNATATFIRDQSANQFKDHVDAGKIVPLEIPLYIVANKSDALKNMSSSDRRILISVLRFIAHHHGATLLATSSTSTDTFRNLMSSLCFRSAMKQMTDFGSEKILGVSAGQDTFENILTGSNRGTGTGDEQPASSSKAKSLAVDGDMSPFLGANGLTPDCWKRLTEIMKNSFGAADAPSDDALARSDEDQLTSGAPASSQENEYPEPDVDSLRSQRDVLLLRYIQDAERKEAMQAKMAARGGGAGDGEDNSNNPQEDATVRRKSTKK